MDSVKGLINETFKEKEPWQIVTITTGSVLGAVWMWNFAFNQDETLIERGKKQVFKIVKCIPSVREKIDKQMTDLNASFEKDAAERLKNVKFFVKLPSEGLTHDQVIEKVKENVHLGNFDWQNGKVSGTVYKNDPDLIKLMTEVYGIASYTNPLHLDIFPGVCKMEAEIIRIACRLFNGDESSCGCMTTGGTESILMACKAYRDYAREVNGIKYPEMVIPVTAHAAFDKAAKYLKIKIRTVPVNHTTYTVSIDAMKNSINKNTIMLVGSAPNFPYGTMDNIEAISKLGIEYNVPVHVDACLGGFLICFMPDAGYQVAPFDFRLQGVTSISADTHKYGYAPKGSSLILYKNKTFRHYQYTISTDWPGGVYGSPSVNGSRAGGIIAACWAAIMHFGYDGYVSVTKKIIDTTRYIEAELRKMDGIFILGTPATSVIAIGSKRFHIYRLSEALSKRGWNLNTLQFPNAIHFCVTHVHTQSNFADQFLDDVKNILIDLNKTPDEEVSGKLAIYGMSQSVPDRAIVSDIIKHFMDAMYYTPKSIED